MRLDRAAIALSLFAIALPACKRPLTGREFTGGSVRDVRVEPEYVRQAVPMKISFRLDGGAKGDVSYAIANKKYPCKPDRLADGRFECTHVGVSRIEFTQGLVDVVVTASDLRGQETSGTASITLDFDCPQVDTLTVSPGIGSPGSTSVVNIEASEPLSLPPVISRGGRVWETPLGDGTTWSIDHQVTEEDPSSSIDVIVRLVDLAGNTSGDCGVDGRQPFSVDRAPPTVAADKIEVVRDVPGLPATIAAEEGAFMDDVGVTEVHVVTRDDNGADTVIATLFPLSDGSLPLTPLEGALTGRAYVQAVDVAFKTSTAVLVRERWRLSVGMGEAPNAAIRTAVRYAPAPPRTPSLDNRTRELAVSIFTADTQSAVIDASVGFKNAGSLPTNYRNTQLIAAGYSKKSKAIVAFGGIAEDMSYRGETVVIRWNELLHTYEHEVFPAVPGMTPPPRAAVNIAFDRTGCGVLWGGFDDDRFFNDLWQVCLGPNGPVWTPIPNNNTPAGRFTAMLWDPVLDRFAISFGSSEVRPVNPIILLDPGDRSGPWKWVPMTELPRDLEQNYRYQSAFYYDTRFNGYAIGLGSTDYYGGDFWSMVDGLWVHSQYPFDLWFRFGFGFAYDLARSYLVAWGDGRDMAVDIDDDTWFLAEDPRTGIDAWKRIDFAPTTIRGDPVLVYDEDRETIVVFGGKRAFDTLPVPPDIDVLVTPPSFAYLEADLDLDDVRPTGIASLELDIRADGSGDADGVGPGSTSDGGVIVSLWNHETLAWDQVAFVDTPPAGPPIDIPILITLDPARYVSPDGVVPVAIGSQHPATEEVAARLEIDLVDGHLELSAEANPGAKVVAFDASPAVVTAGDRVTLSWIARDAPGGIRINVGAATIFDSLQLEGTFTTTPTVTTTYTLVAVDPASGDATLSRTVTVKPPIAAPIVLDFSSLEAAAPRGGISHLRWSTDRASTVRILRGDTEIYQTTSAASTGTFDATLPGGTVTSTAFRIEASNANGVDRRADVVQLASERILVGPGMNDTYADSIAVPGEVDLFIVEMTMPGYIEASIFSPSRPNCSNGVDTYMKLLDENLNTIGSRDDGGVGSCSAFVRGTDDFILVPAGRYYISVEQYDGNQAIAAYTLEVVTTAIACGNGFVEPSEACDDGNTTGGDGCSAACRLEVQGTYSAPADGHAVLPGAISVAGRVAVYQVNVTATTLVSFATFIAASPNCTADTVINLLADDQMTQLGRDDDSGVNACSMLSSVLNIGTYYLVVHDYGDNGTIPAFELVIDSLGSLASEAEPNNTSGEATSLGTLAPGTSSATTAASINPSGDEDWFSFVLPQPASVRITSFSDPTDRSVCINDNVMYFYNASAVELANADDVNGVCGALDGITGTDVALTGLAAGTYFVKMTAYGSQLITTYLIAIEVQ